TVRTTARMVQWSRGESNPRPLECDSINTLSSGITPDHARLQLLKTTRERPALRGRDMRAVVSSRQMNAERTRRAARNRWTSRGTDAIDGVRDRTRPRARGSEFAHPPQIRDPVLNASRPGPGLRQRP